MILSTLASRTIEDVAAALGDTPRWFQLYWPWSDALTASFLRRAEDAGYSALVVTLDTFFLGWRERDLQHAYLPFNLGAGLANYFSDPVFRAMLPTPPEDDPAGAIQRFGRLYSNPTLTWENLAFLRQHTRLPILLKGILCPPMRSGRWNMESTASSCPTTAAGRSTGPWPPSTRCLGSSRPSPAGRSFCSTAASAAGRTSSRPWAGGPRCPARPPFLLRPGRGRRAGGVRRGRKPAG